MNISLSTPLLVVILIAVLVLTLIVMRISGGPRTHSIAKAPGKSKADRPSVPVENPQHNGHLTPERGDKGAEVAARYGHSRSPEWESVARAHLQIEPACMACGYKGKGLQVHHIKPFHLFPELELDPNNLITLCEIKGRDHHLLIGHLDNWESYNLNVRTDVKRFHKEDAAHLRANSVWQEEEVHRPVPQR
jgi:5-methylcytosine-specific restriction endonuclease McrA